MKKERFHIAHNFINFFNMITARKGFYQSCADVHSSLRSVEPGEEVGEGVGFCWTTQC